MAQSEDIHVSNNEDESRFEATIGGKVSMVEYTMGEGTIALTHTEVPQELAGRGIAQKLVTTALDYARDKKLRVVPLCSYAAKFIERHPEYQELVGGGGGN